MFATIWNNIINYPILNLVLVFYHLFGNNLGWAIIFIAAITRLAMIPLMRNQTEMTRKMAGMKPQLDDLQKKYKNNPQKLSEEQMKLYKTVGYNPLGCMVTFIPQLIVLSVLIVVIRNVTANNIDGIYPFIKTWFASDPNFSINTGFLWWDLTKTYSGVAGEFGKFSIQALSYLFLALGVGISQYITTVFTQKVQNPNVAPKTQKKKAGEPISPEQLQTQMMNSMNLILPLSTVFIAVSAPSALSVYWIVQSLMLVVQYCVLDWDKTKKGVQNLLTRYIHRKK
jgi:YidC/Oxa1 family membrane protein insertase